MFPGKFALSEVPLSSDPTVRQNGDILSKNFVIDQVYSTAESITKENPLELLINSESDFGVYNIDEEITFELSIDLKSSFSLTN